MMNCLIIMFVFLTVISWLALMNWHISIIDHTKKTNITNIKK